MHEKKRLSEIRKRQSNFEVSGNQSLTQLLLKETNINRVSQMQNKKSLSINSTTF